MPETSIQAWYNLIIESNQIMSTKSTPNTKNLTYHNLSLQFAKILINLCPMLELGLEPNYVGMEHTSLIITITDPGSILIKFSKMLS